MLNTFFRLHFRVWGVRVAVMMVYVILQSNVHFAEHKCNNICTYHMYIYISLLYMYFYIYVYVCVCSFTYSPSLPLSLSISMHCSHISGLSHCSGNAEAKLRPCSTCGNRASQPGTVIQKSWNPPTEAVVQQNPRPKSRSGSLRVQTDRDINPTRWETI